MSQKMCSRSPLVTHRRRYLHPLQITPTLVLALTATCAAGNELTVDDDNPADYSTIQEAIDAASDGDVILVYPGTYTAETAGEVANLRGKEITLRSIAGPAETIIDGEGARRGLLCENGETNTTVIEGFKVTDCRAPSDCVGCPLGTGAGMYIKNATPLVVNCTFSENVALSGGGMAIVESNNTESPTQVVDCLFELNDGKGGGMSIKLSNPTLDNVHFRENSQNSTTATLGGGLRGIDSNPHLKNCLFEENGTYALTQGGGAHFLRTTATEDSRPLIENCTFRNNLGSYGGGLNLEGGSPIVRQCVIENNNSSQDGGGLLVANTVLEDVAPNQLGAPLIELTYFSLNNAASFGGGAHCGSRGSGNPDDPRSPTFDRCVFNQNSAAQGGGISMEGGNVSEEFFGTPNIRGCSFIRNSANTAGGLDCSPSDKPLRPTVSYSLFMCNEAESDGGAAHVGQGTDAITFAQCLFHDNQTVNGSGGGLLFGVEPFENAPRGDSLICNSHFQYNKALADGTCGACESSSGIGSGCGGGLFIKDTAWCAELLTKYTNNSFDQNQATAECTDNVRVPTGCTPDCDIDLTCGQVWETDTTRTLESISCSEDLNPLRWLFENESACRADITGDNQVDGADLSSLLGAWGQGCPDDLDQYPTTCGDAEAEQATPFSETLHGAACCEGTLNLNDKWLARARGTAPACADINDDGIVDGTDLSILLGAWGPCE